MAKRLLTPQKIVNLTGDPAVGSAGELYYNTTIKTYKYHDGTSWIGLGEAGAFLEAADATQEPTGIIDKNALTLSFVDGTRVATVAPTSGSYDYYYFGEKVTVSTSQEVTIPNTTGTHFIYFADNLGTITQSMTQWNLSSTVPIMAVFWDATQGAGVVLEERHGVTMDWATHQYLHQTEGSRVISGFGASGYTLNSAVNANITPDIDTGLVADEDLRTQIPALVAGTGVYKVWYRLGVAGDWTWSSQDYPFTAGTTYVHYNQLTGGAWQRTELSSNQYVNMWAVAVPTVTTGFGIIFIMGQAVHASLAAAQQESISSLNVGTLPFTEMAALYRVTFRTNSGYTSAGKSRIESFQRIVGTSVTITQTGISSHSGLSGLSDPNAHPATSIPTDTTNFNSLLASTDTTVQAALDHIDNTAVTTDTTQTITADKTFSGDFNVNHVDFAASPTGGGAVGRLIWNSGESSLDLGLSANVTLQLGQEQLVKVYNGTGGTLTDGQVVYITGAQGQRPSVALAQANSEAASSVTLGVVTEPITNLSEGFIATAGVVRGLNTTAFTEGAALWLSPTVAGGITTTKPVAPNHGVLIGYCVRNHGSAGQIFVHIQNGYELDELHDVLISTVADNHVLSYDNATGVWKNQALVDAIKEIDGASSGIDADLLDGQHGSYYTTAGNLTGTIPSSVLGNSTLYVGTTAVALNRSSANQDLTGITSVDYANANDGSATVTVTGTGATAIDSWAVATYSAVEYMIQLKQGVTTTAMKLLVMYDGTDVHYAEYARLNSTGGGVDIDALEPVLNGSNVELRLTSSTANVTNVVCKIKRTLIKA